jgi:putative heme-binding domain-containing protein
MLADSVATGFSKLGADGLAVLAEKLPTADPARRDCGVEALAGYAAAGRGLTAGEPLVTMLAAAWDANPQPAFRAKVLACLAAIDPASWKAAENSRGRAEKLLLAAAGDPDPRLLGRVPAVATSLGIPTPKLAEPRPPAQAADVLARLKDADPARGAKLFADARGANCGACHRAGGHGVGGIGPELSDIGLRAAPAAILESILQPSATIIEGYRVSTLVLDDGRSLTGLVLDDTPDTVRVIDIEGRSTSVQKATIEERAVQQVSLMPAGYDRTLSPEELANLVAFLLAQKRPAGQVAAVGGPTNPLSWLEGDDLAAACANLGPDEKRKFREAGELLDLRPVCLPRGEWLHTDGKGVPLTHFGWPVAVRHGGVIHVVYTRGFSHSRPTEGDTSAARTAVARSTDDGRSFVPAQGLKNGCFDDIPFSMQPKAPAPAAGRPQWTNMIGVGGPRSAGVIDGKIVIASDDGVYRSEDDGRTWRRLEAAGLPAQIPTVPTFGAGPDLLVHPRQGLVSLGATTDHKLLVRTSKDHGQTWREREFQFDEPIQEPSGLIHDGRLILMPRTAAAIGTPKPGARGYYHYWSDPDWTTFQKQATNILAGERDTTDVKFNPVSKRFEAVVTNRMGGGPGHEADNCMTINLWSIAPDALLAGSGEWRFDGTLLRTEGREHDRGNALKLERDGMCPGGSVIAEDLGVQFIYVYLGHFQGPTGIFQVTRSLDTDRLRRFLLEDQ